MRSKGVQSAPRVVSVSERRGIRETSPPGVVAEIAAELWTGVSLFQKGVSNVERV